jgi:hypothetical protein
MILGVGDVHISGCVNGDAFGEVQLCRGGGSIVAVVGSGQGLPVPAKVVIVKGEA